MGASDRELAKRALAGDQDALQILRERGRLTADESPRSYPLTNGQRRLWLLSKVEGGSVAYNMPVVFFLKDVDREALLEALQTIVDRHEALRTTFSDGNGTPCQLVHPHMELMTQYLDLSGHDDAESRAQTYVEKEVARPFQLDVGPLLRASLLRVSHHRHLLLLSFHHIVCDEWSISVLLRELDALVAGEELVPLRLQYSDFAVWQEEWLRGEAAAADRRYWHEQLAGEIPALDLPTDRARPPVRSFRGATVSASLSADLTTALRSFNRRHRVSLFVTMVTVIKVILHRYSGATDIVVGSPFAGRNRPELEELIGFFANTVALRDRFDSDTPFLTLLEQVSQTVSEAYDHQDYPLDLLVDELGVHRGPSRSPMFDVMVAPLTSGDQDLAGQGLSLQPLAARTRTSKFDLIFFIDDRDDLQIRVEYSTDLFAEDRIRRLTVHLEELVRGLLADPHQPVGRLPMLSAAERQAILERFSFGPPEPSFVPVTDLFEQQLAVSPDTPAVVCGELTWSYQELAERAAAIACALNEQEQIGADEAVAALLGRSQWLPAAALGILRAGAAYLPIDPAYPERRIQQMVESAVCRLVVTDSEHTELAGRCLSHLPVRVASTIWEERGDSVRELAPVVVQPEQLAYLIFTSGSTGRPKAVRQTHRCLSNLVQWQRQQVGDGWTMLHGAALDFDVSVQELIFSLVSGATLHIIPEELRRDPVKLAGYIEEQQVELLILPYSLLNLLLREARWKSDEMPLRHVITSGEKLTLFRELRGLLEAHPQVTLHNQYGPAETHVVTACTFSALRGNLDRSPPIGKPISGTEILILDRRGEPTPVGVPGEICVAGAGVARGYDQAGSTAAAFMPKPSGTGQRLYRTGDRGCWMSDGQIELLGRDDDQIKIRGFRVEPDGVAAVLLEQQEISEAVVVARSCTGGGKELVAYLVLADDDRELSLPRLRRRLMEELPDYMIPARFVGLSELPLNPHGKVDRSALPEPDASNMVPGDEPTPPRDASERLLVDICEKLLGRRGVGIRDSFFDLGGSSFLAVRLMSAIEVHFGERLPLSTLLAGATVEHLAESLRERQRRQSWSPLVVVGGDRTRTPLLFVHPVGGNVLSYYELARLLGSEQPLLMLQALGVEEGQIPFATVEELADYYLEAVSKERPAGPYLLVGWSFGGLVAYEMARRIEQLGEQVGMLVVIDIHANSSVPEWVDQVDDAGLIEYIFADVVEVSAEEQRALDPGARLAYIVERLQQSDYPLESTEAAHARRLLQLFRSNTIAALKYVPQPYSGKMSLFRARDGSRQDDEIDPTLGWGDLASGGVELIWVPGNHQSIVSSPNVEVLAQRLCECVDRFHRERAQSS